MPPFVLIGLAAGLASAVIFVSASGGGMPARMLLFFLTPLPGFLAGLGWGWLSAAVAALVSGLVVAAVGGPMSALVALLTQGLPPVILTYLVLLARPVGEAAGSAALPPPPDVPATAPALEWYPLGRVLAIAAVIAGTLAVVTLLIIGQDLDKLRAGLRELLEKVLINQLPGFKDRQLSEPEIRTFVEIALYTLPAASALSWLGGLLLNLWLAARITLASGRLLRPWPDIPATALPRGFGFGLALALVVASTTSGWPALVASAYAGAFFCAYFFIGLAILHYLTRGSAARPVILWGLYVALLVLNSWAAVVLALIAIMEPLLPWRRARMTPPAGPD